MRQYIKHLTRLRKTPHLCTVYRHILRPNYLSCNVLVQGDKHVYRLLNTVGFFIGYTADVVISILQSNTSV